MLVKHTFRNQYCYYPFRRANVLIRILVSSVFCWHLVSVGKGHQMAKRLGNRRFDYEWRSHHASAYTVWRRRQGWRRMARGVGGRRDIRTPRIEISATTK